MDTLNPPLKRSKGLGDSVYYTFGHFRKTNKKDVDWLVLGSLDKTVKENKELRDSDSQLKVCINDLRASMSSLKEGLISCSHRAGIAANQMQNLILQGSGAQHFWHQGPVSWKTIFPQTRGGVG